MSAVVDCIFYNNQQFMTILGKYGHKLLIVVQKFNYLNIRTYVHRFLSASITYCVHTF